MTSTITLNVRMEHLRDALGIGMDRPRLSWIIETDRQEWHQSGYEIEEYDADGKLMNQTGRVESDQSVLIDWPFALLASRQQVSVRARVWGKDEGASDWSEPVLLETGLLIKFSTSSFSK